VLATEFATFAVYRFQNVPTVTHSHRLEIDNHSPCTTLYNIADSITTISTNSMCCPIPHLYCFCDDHCLYSVYTYFVYTTFGSTANFHRCHTSPPNATPTTRKIGYASGTNHLFCHVLGICGSLAELICLRTRKCANGRMCVNMNLCILFCVCVCVFVECMLLLLTF